MRVRFLIVILGVAALALGGALVGAYAYDHSMEDVVATGVTAGGIDVGGMTEAEARAALQRALAPRLGRTAVVVYRERRFALAPASAQIRPDVGAMAHQALDESRRGNFFRRTARELLGHDLHERVRLRVRYSDAAVTSFVARVARVIDRPPHNAKVIPSAEKLLAIRSRRGVAVRGRVLARELRAKLRAGHVPTGLRVPTRWLNPKTSTDKLAREDRFYIIVDRGARKLRLYRWLKPAKTYTIAVGQIGLETPAGLYHIQTKVIDPAWHVPLSAWAGSLAGRVIPGGVPENPLKARWLGIYNGAGIHGTDDIASLGTAASHGCIRMSIPDVIELYSIVPLHTPVYIA
jgi:hypothetical protein